MEISPSEYSAKYKYKLPENVMLVSYKTKFKKEMFHSNPSGRGEYAI